MSEDDPFEELDEAVEDREGDPFESLTDADDENATESANPEDAEADPDPGSDETLQDSGDGDDSMEWLGEGSADPHSEAHDQDSEDGMEESKERVPGDTSEMEFGIGRREHEGTPEAPSLGDVGTREGNPFESVEGAFEQMDTGEIDPDAVWQNLASAESRGSVGEVQDRTYAEVSKHSYCEQCEYFSEPPDVECLHEGTDIIEFLDMETVRVVDCPIVAEREELEDS